MINSNQHWEEGSIHPQQERVNYPQSLQSPNYQGNRHSNPAPTQQYTQNHSHISHSDKISDHERKDSKTAVNTSAPIQHYRYTSNYEGGGLPNIGFTCFLNSVIQFLYAADQFRDDVMKVEFFEDPFTYQLGEIFKCIKDDSSNAYKTVKMQVFANSLKSMKDDYKSYTQQDALQFLLLILNAILPKLLQKFTLIYMTKCQCPNSKQKFNELYLPANPLSCVHCNTILHTSLLKAQKYLILMGPINSPIQQEFQMNGGECKFAFCSSVMYSGNGEMGHYVAHRRNAQSQMRCYDDKYVYTPWGQRERKAMLMLYQNKTKIEEEPSKKVVNLQKHSKLQNKFQLKNNSQIQTIPKLKNHSQLETTFKLEKTNLQTSNNFQSQNNKANQNLLNSRGHPSHTFTQNNALSNSINNIHNIQLSDVTSDLIPRAAQPLLLDVNPHKTIRQDGCRQLQPKEVAQLPAKKGEEYRGNVMLSVSINAQGTASPSISRGNHHMNSFKQLNPEEKRKVEQYQRKLSCAKIIDHLNSEQVKISIYKSFNRTDQVNTVRQFTCKINVVHKMIKDKVKYQLRRVYFKFSFPEYLKNQQADSYRAILLNPQHFFYLSKNKQMIIACHNNIKTRLSFEQALRSIQFILERDAKNHELFTSNRAEFHRKDLLESMQPLRNKISQCYAVEYRE